MIQIVIFSFFAGLWAILFFPVASLLAKYKFPNAFPIILRDENNKVAFSGEYSKKYLIVFSILYLQILFALFMMVQFL